MALRKTHCIRGHDQRVEGARDKSGHCNACLKITYRARQTRKGLTVREKLPPGEAKARKMARALAWARRHADKRRASRQRWMEKHPEYFTERHYRARYKISKQEFDGLLAAQENQCAICERTEPKGRNWHLDHCHDSGLIRGVLCHSCNVGIGLLGDTDEAVLRAYTYLASFYRERKHLKLA